MSVILTAREVRGLMILEISGRLTVLDHSLREAVRENLLAGHRQFILKMNELSYMDSCGLGELVTVYTSIRNAGGNLRLFNPSERVRKLLNITKLDTVFEIIQDEAALADVKSVVAIQNKAS